jgi:L-rhamnose mutarotase
MMKHEEKVRKHEQWHRDMAELLSSHNAKNLPKHVKKEKLQEAYNKLEGYEFRLVKKKRPGK